MSVSVLLRPPTNQPEGGEEGLSVTDTWCPTTELQGQAPGGPRLSPKPGCSWQTQAFALRPKWVGTWDSDFCPRLLQAWHHPHPYPHAKVAL